MNKSLLTGCLVIGTLPLQAVERPAELNEKPHELKEQSPPQVENAEVGSQKAPQVQAKGEEKKVAIVEVMPLAGERPFLGVGSEPVDATLSAHLGLDAGLVVQQVHPGSGAANAGLQVHDIVVAFNGEKVATPLALRDVVARCKVGQTVPLEVIRKGKNQMFDITLTARPHGLPGIDIIPLPGEVGDAQVWPGDLLPKNAKEHLEELRNMIDMQGLGLKLNEMLQDMPQGGAQMDIDLNAESTVTLADGQGDITMTMRNGNSEVKVRDREGNVVFYGPWDTEQDKASVDPEIRKRIEGLDLKREGNQLRFWMDGAPENR